MRKSVWAPQIKLIVLVFFSRYVIAVCCCCFGLILVYFVLSRLHSQPHYLNHMTIASSEQMTKTLQHTNLKNRLNLKSRRERVRERGQLKRIGMIIIARKWPCACKRWLHAQYRNNEAARDGNWRKKRPWTTQHHIKFPKSWSNKTQRNDTIWSDCSQCNKSAHSLIYLWQVNGVAKLPSWYVSCCIVVFVIKAETLKGILRTNIGLQQQQQPKPMEKNEQQYSNELRLEIDHFQQIWEGGKDNDVHVFLHSWV